MNSLQTRCSILIPTNKKFGVCSTKLLRKSTQNDAKLTGIFVGSPLAEKIFHTKRIRSNNSSTILDGFQIYPRGYENPKNPGNAPPMSQVSVAELYTTRSPILSIPSVIDYAGLCAQKPRLNYQSSLALGKERKRPSRES